jgi:hypothetical protein
MHPSRNRRSPIPPDNRADHKINAKIVRLVPKAKAKARDRGKARARVIAGPISVPTTAAVVDPAATAVLTVGIAEKVAAPVDALSTALRLTSSSKS